MAALLSNAMALLHIAINIIAFDAFARKSWVLMAVVVLSHIAGAYFVRILNCFASRNPNDFML